MRQIVRKNVTVDDVSLYLALRVKVLPDLYDVFLDDLTKMERMGQVCLVPITILQRYHNKFRKAG